MTRDLGHERGRRHAGLGVDLEQHHAAGLAAGVVVAQIGAADAAAAERAMRRERDLERRRIGAANGSAPASIWTEPPGAYFAA